MKHRLFRNWQLKLIALGLAVMVWFTIQREASTDIAVIHNVRVEPVAGDGYRVEEVMPQRVSIEVRGDRHAVTAITADHFLARPALGSITSDGEWTLALSESIVESPPKIRVLKVDPPQVRVRVRIIVSERAAIIP